MCMLVGVTSRMLGLISALAVVGCGGFPISDDDVGESASDETDTAGSTDSTTGSTDSTDTTGSTDSTDTDSTETDSTDSDSTETTGEDLSCEDDSYIGQALATDDWGLGDLCDEIWVCADEGQVALIQAAVPNAMCVPGQGCPGSHCTISDQTIVDADVLAIVCDALLVPGIDEAYCIVYGP